MVLLRVPNKSNNKVVRKTQNKRKSIPSVELKSVDVATQVATDTTGSLTLLNGIVPGVGFSQRLGRMVAMQRADIFVNSVVTAATGIDQYQRVLVVMDRQANAAAPAITDILMSVSISAQYNLINAARFRILSDRRLYLNAAGEPGSGKAWKISLPMSSRVRYNDGTAGTVADIATNSVYFITIGSVAAGATAGSTGFNSRVRYTDY